MIETEVFYCMAINDDEMAMEKMVQDCKDSICYYKTLEQEGTFFASTIEHRRDEQMTKYSGESGSFFLNCES